MRLSKAEGGRQKAEGGCCLALAIVLLSAVGCTSRISPAAPTSINPDTATQSSTDEPVDPSKSDTNTADSDAAPMPRESAQDQAPSNDQLASASSTAIPPPAAETKPEPAAAAKSARPRDVTFDTIKFEMKKEEPFFRSMLTPTIEKLVGTRIRIRGYILPSFQSTGITQFVLVRDNLECCFGPGAALFDCIVVEMSPDNTANFSTRPVAVEGVFSIDEVKYPDDDKRHLAIYHMVADKVQ